MKRPPKPYDCSMEVDAVYARRPSWAVGTISRCDARFLFDRVVRAGATEVVEIGSASGVSTAILCEALAASHHAGRIGGDYRVAAYDLNERFYADQGRATGEAIDDMLSPELRRHVEFRIPATAIDVRDHYATDSLAFAFIDASHKHPWPALDLLAILPSVRPGAEVAMHDINLPLIHSGFPTWGSKWLYDALEVEKHADASSDPPNIGSVVVPDDKAGLEQRLREIVDAHEWEVTVHESFTRPLLGAGIGP